MKMIKPRLLLITLLLALCASQAGARAPKVEKTPAQKLIERLTKLQKRGIMTLSMASPGSGSRAVPTPMTLLATTLV